MSAVAPPYPCNRDKISHYATKRTLCRARLLSSDGSTNKAYVCGNLFLFSPRATSTFSSSSSSSFSSTSRSNLDSRSIFLRNRRTVSFNRPALIRSGRIKNIYIRTLRLAQCEYNNKKEKRNLLPSAMHVLNVIRILCPLRIFAKCDRIYR